ncbi:hypothetical protein [Erythrobacter sp. CCH5-A1]|jgi:hypothetical protein|uniref:hypothetical protein n=1 Tax=Erythrobacter sp. CCH5-A1 TaxID=1768792 RepID=UPI00083537B5|nr:hypothetical protein [Erythrobacter sp. CCH5-A1]
MAHELERLAAGQSHIFGGQEIDIIKVGPIHFDVDVEVTATFAGKKTGGGQSARLELWIDGAKIVERSDANFDTYSLVASAKIVMASGSSIAIRSARSNTSATTTGQSLTAKFTRKP